MSLPLQWAALPELLSAILHRRKTGKGTPGKEQATHAGSQADWWWQVGWACDTEGRDQKKNQAKFGRESGSSSKYVWHSLSRLHAAARPHLWQSSSFLPQLIRVWFTHQQILGICSRDLFILPNHSSNWWNQAYLQTNSPTNRWILKRSSEKRKKWQKKAMSQSTNYSSWFREKVTPLNSSCQHRDSRTMATRII